jgi:hypothetical protein
MKLQLYASLQQLTWVKERDAVSMHSSFWCNHAVEGTSVSVIGPSGKKIADITDNTGTNRMRRYLQVISDGDEKPMVLVHHAIG